MSGQNALFHFVSTCSKKIIHKEIDDPCRGFPLCWATCYGIQCFFKCSVHFWSLTQSSEDIFRAVLLCYGPSSPELTRLCRIQHVTASVSSCGNHAITTQSFLKEVPPSVGGHHSCHMQVSSVMQQCEEDDLLLVAIDTRHHGSHHKTALEDRLFWNQCEKDSNLCWLPSGNSSEIRVLWKQGILFADIPSVCRGNLSIPILPFALRKLPCMSVLMVSTHLPVT